MIRLLENPEMAVNRWLSQLQHLAWMERVCRLQVVQLHQEAPINPNTLAEANQCC